MSHLMGTVKALTGSWDVPLPYFKLSSRSMQTLNVLE